MKKLALLLTLTACSSNPLAPPTEPVTKTNAKAMTVALAAPTPVSQCGDVWGDIVLTADVSSTADCFTPKVAGVTIDGAGHTITTPKFAVNVLMKDHVTVKNIKTTASVQVYGGENKADGFMLLNSTTGWIGLYSVSNAVLDNNQITGGFTWGYLSQTGRSLNNRIMNNRIEGSSTRLVDMAGNWGDSTHPCPVTNDFIYRNRVINNQPDDVDEALTFYIRCNKGFTFKGNSVAAYGQAGGLVMRDGASQGLIEQNVFFVEGANSGNRGAIQTWSGNEGTGFKGYPSDLVIKGNTIIAVNGYGTWFQALGDRNSFIENRVYGFDKGCFFASTDRAKTMGKGLVFSGNAMTCSKQLVWADNIVGPGLVWDQP